MIVYNDEVLPFVGLVIRFDQKLSSEASSITLARVSRLLLDDLTESGWARAYQEGLPEMLGDPSSVANWVCPSDDLSIPDRIVFDQIHALYRKRQDVSPAADRDDAARAKIGLAESACRVTNSSFRAWCQGRFQFRPGVERILHAAQRKIADVLGELPSYEEVRPRFGPGASTRVKKKNACLAVKLDAPLACSANLTHELPELLGSINVSIEGLVSVEIDAAKQSFVPKTAKVSRAIATEPGLNGLYQLAYGDYIARRLRTVGIDIRDQTRNQRAALYGSLSGDRATIDLSMASDTVAIGLVSHLLPDDWYDRLSALRSAFITDSNSPRVTECFSSMGNGFTFALETLIFWALARSAQDLYDPVSGVPVLTYGDDIIVSSRTAPGLLCVLRDLGFVPNPDKTFWTGTFRESCGCDYVLGTPVRPVFVDDALSGADFFRLRNFFWAAGRSRVSSFLEDCIHPSVVRYGPVGYGDGHLHTQIAEMVGPPAKKAHRLLSKGYNGFTFETWTQQPKRLRGALYKRYVVAAEKLRYQWNPSSNSWDDPVVVTKLVFRKKYDYLVRRIATYTAYLREDPLLDRIEAKYGHVNADRLMPEPEPYGREREFVVPGEGDLVLTRVYALNQP